jgi:lauroyl/myristoyl acyltransferase
MGDVRDQLQRVRGLIPLRLLPSLARRRADSLWLNEEFRTAQLAEMEFAHGHTDRAGEIEQVARGYTEFALLRDFRRWRPRHLARQPVHGAEWLTSRRDPDRGVLLSFVHHGQYDGLFPSLGRVGVAMQTVVAPEAFDPASPVQLRQHFKVAGMAPETTLVPTTIGTAGMIGLIEQRKIVAIASDVAGRTPIEFLGRTISTASGAARIAIETNAPVVLVTSHRQPSGRPSLTVHPPLEPGDFADPTELLQEMMRRHGEAVLAWPEAFDSPYSRLVRFAGG